MTEPSEKAMKMASKAAAMPLHAQQYLRETLGIEGAQEIHENIAHAIDAAIVEERERCARIAESEGNNWPVDCTCLEGFGAAIHIATMIRAPANR